MPSKLLYQNPDNIPIFHGQICCYRHYYTNIPWINMLLQTLLYQYSMDKDIVKNIVPDLLSIFHGQKKRRKKSLERYILFQTFYQYSMDKDIVPYIIPLLHGQRYCFIHHTTITWAKILFHISYQYYMGKYIVSYIIPILHGQRYCSCRAQF